MTSRDSSGREIDFDNYDQSFDYNDDGTINYITATHGAESWRKTYTYSDGKVIGESAWVKQP